MANLDDRDDEQQLSISEDDFWYWTGGCVDEPDSSYICICFDEGQL